MLWLSGKQSEKLPRACRGKARGQKAPSATWKTARELQIAALHQASMNPAKAKTLF